MSSQTDSQPIVGFIGLGVQGLPMATAIAKAGYSLHVWDRRRDSFDALRNVAHTRHDSAESLAPWCDIVGLCVNTDADVFEVVADGLVGNLRPGSTVVNHGTGTPRAAVRLTKLCGDADVTALDAPVSGGAPAAAAGTLLTMVGGAEAVAQHCDPVFRSFSQHVVYLGGAGSGQLMKLLNNAVLMMNQANIADIVALATELGLDAPAFADVLKLGSGSSTALTLLNTMVTLENVDHLAAVQRLDMELFEDAMSDRGVRAPIITARAMEGTNSLKALMRELNP